MLTKKELRRKKRKYRIRKIISGTPDRPRLSVFRSNRCIYAQLIDDTKAHTLLTASSGVQKNTEKRSKTDQAKITGKHLAGKALRAGIVCVVFDRGGYLYHGRVKALAEGAREGGLKF